MTTQTEATPARGNTNGTALKGGNLHQRIAAIKKAAQVKVTGTTGKGKGDRPAMSIADMDRALGELMAEHGVHSTYTFLDEPTSYEEKSREGTYRIWRVHIRGFLVNVDDPIRRDEQGQIVGGDYDEAELYDDGTNVSGGVSFALKRWQREVFKLAEDDTSSQEEQRDGAQSAGDFTDPRTARQSSAPATSAGGSSDRPDLMFCPSCGVKAVIPSKPEYGGGWVCYKKKDGCGAKFDEDDQRIQAQIGGPADDNAASSDVSGGNTADQSASPSPPITAEQKAELTKLHNSLPTDLQLDNAAKRKLLEEGYESAKATLTALEDEAISRSQTPPHQAELEQKVAAAQPIHGADEDPFAEEEAK